MNTKALYNITYGVYLLSAKENGRDNACIINTAVQVANNPTRISIAAIKGNLTHDMILATGVFNLSSITSDAPYSLFQHFGMQSGYNVNKFADFTDVARSENGLLYLTKYANAVLSLKVTESYDLGSHTLFIGELTDSEVLSSGECCSYGYYQSTIKKAAPKPIAKEGWKCKICGHVYEDKELPADYICPLCKHGAEDFEYFNETTDKEVLDKIFVSDESGDYIYQQNLNIFNNPAFEYTNKIAPGVGNTYDFVVHNSMNENVNYYLNNGYDISNKVGLSGLEFVYDEYLKGVDEVYNLTNENMTLISDGETGKDLKLTIDINLQKYVDDVLNQEIIKLQDPEYLARYAREKYFYSKDGELIIKLPDEEENE